LNCIVQVIKKEIALIPIIVHFNPIQHILEHVFLQCTLV
jgi:hypothetical protein